MRPALGVVRQRRQRDIVGDRGFHQEAFAAAILGQERHSAGDAGARRNLVQFLAVDDNVALRVRIEPEQDPRHFRPPRAHQAGHAQHFARLQRECDVLDDAGLAQPLHLKTGSPARGREVRGGKSWSIVRPTIEEIRLLGRLASAVGRASTTAPSLSTTISSQSRITSPRM